MPDWEPEIKGRRVTKMACHLDTFSSKPLEVSKSIYDANFLNITLRRSSSREKVSDNVADADTLFFPVFYAAPSGIILPFGKTRGGQKESGFPFDACVPHVRHCVMKFEKMRGHSV